MGQRIKAYREFNLKKKKRNVEKIKDRKTVALTWKLSGQKSAQNCKTQQKKMPTQLLFSCKE